MQQFIRTTTQRSLRLCLLAGLLAGLLGSGSTPAYAAPTSITIISGGGSGGVGTPDPTIMYSTLSGVSSSAVIMPTYTTYTTIPGTRWVNTSGLSGFAGPDQGSSQTITYIAYFTLPADFMSPSITVQILADNQASVSLNGIEIGVQPDPRFQPQPQQNFQTISTFSWSTSSDFIVGVNTLSIANTDYDQPNGVNFKAIITYAEACAPGTYNNGSGCVQAAPGYYVSVSGATEQTPCDVGYYQPNAGVVSCIPADAGHYVDVTAAVMQIDCLPGSYQPNSGSTSCILAEAGFYVPEPAATEQILCPRSTTSTAAGATDCTLPLFNFSGFLQPVDNLPALNQVKAGQAIPVKFGLGGNQGLNILASGSPSSVKITCDASAVVDAIEQTVTAGGSSLTYDATTDTYTYVWKTDKSWANTCRQLKVTLTDGTVHTANFKFSK